MPTGIAARKRHKRQHGSCKHQLKQIQEENEVEYFVKERTVMTVTLPFYHHLPQNIQILRPVSDALSMFTKRIS